MRITDRVAAIIDAHQPDSWAFTWSCLGCDVDFHICDTPADHMAVVITTELGLTEFTAVDVHWWATRIEPIE